MSRQILQDALNGIRDEYITEAGEKLGLLTAGAAAISGAATSANQMYTIPGGTASGATAKAGFGAWLAKGGWVALAAGAVAAAGIAVGAFFLSSGGDATPVGDAVSQTTDETNVIQGDTQDDTQNDTDNETEVCTHTFGDWQETVTATCTASGQQSRACTLCGLTETDATLPIPHTFQDDICTVCGAAASKLEFTSNGDGTCSVSGWGDANQTESPLVIPTYSPSGERVISILADALSNTRPFRTYPEEIIISEGVECIEAEAFQGCAWLTSITLPSTLTTIGNNAFTSSGLQSITMAEGLRSIGNGAFFDTHYLTSVTIPASVTELGSGAFANSTALTEVRFANGSALTALPTSVFSETPLTEITLPDSVTAIGEYAFGRCGHLVAVYGKNVTEIGDEAFAKCSSLTALPASLGVDGIGSNALTGCTALATTEYDGGYYMMLGENPYAVLIYGKADVITASIHPDAQAVMGSIFEGNTALTTFTFPDSATEIPDRFFYGCTALVSVNMPASLIRVGEAAFYGCAALPNVTLPEGVLTVEKEAFAGCKAFTEMVLPDSITTIGGSAFADCSNLVSVKLPASLTVISGGLFANCMELSGTLVIPDGVTTIQSSPFARCVELLTVVMPKSVTRFEGQIFIAGVRCVEYAGTMAEWEAIEKDKDWRYGSKAYLDTVICTDGRIDFD
ncbi:MAG: leucine-rich repeat domain-containing protein [Clostridia bacterium]|nr:leucine-rich repeat domain-containing protein [Clostridia bacterium]